MAQRVLVGDPNELLKTLEMNAESSPRHFVDEHEETLIDGIHKVNAVLDDLLEEELLTDHQCTNIRKKRTSQEKMRQLYRYAFVWDTEDKDTFLEILKKYNTELITTMQSKAGQSSDTSEEYFLLSSSSSSPHVDTTDCDLCGKNQDPADIPVMPKISGNTYRLELKCSGRFCCLETGIKFQVTCPVTIEYELDSWHKYMDNPQLHDSEVLGPLFNIRTPVEPNTVSAVYLPHYMCLKKLGDDQSWIKCAHFKDGNLSVETPTQVLPFHVVLKNPSFSSLGVFCWNLLPKVVTKYIPIHGKVLLYFKTAGRKHVEYKIHLYLMPAFAPIDKDLLQEKTSNGFQKIDKPPRTKTVYTKKSYCVNGPEKAHVQPSELEVQCISPLDSYTDITIDGAVKMIDLCLAEEDGKEKVWGCRMSRGEVEDLKSQVPNQTKPKAVPALNCKAKEQLVLNYREALISSVSLVAPILDSLVTEKMLNDEEYDTIRSKPTSQEKMRELFRFSKCWNVFLMAKFYDILEKHNAPLMQNLKEV